MVMIDTSSGWSASASRDELVVSLSGELGGPHAGQFGERFKIEVEDVASTRVVLDLHEVDRIDAAGLVFVQSAKTLVEGLGKTFVLRPPE